MGHIMVCILWPGMEHYINRLHTILSMTEIYIFPCSIS